MAKARCRNGDVRRASPDRLGETAHLYKAGTLLFGVEIDADATDREKFQRARHLRSGSGRGSVAMVHIFYLSRCAVRVRPPVDARVGSGGVGAPGGRSLWRIGAPCHTLQMTDQPVRFSWHS